MVIIHNNKKGNNYIVAKIISNYFNCKYYSVDEDIILDNEDVIIFIVSNIGDEELPPLMENFLFNLKVRNKKYLVCELGNYFGFEDYSGCKKEVFKILNLLGWEKISDISLDSLPILDENKLIKWLEKYEK